MKSPVQRAVRARQFGVVFLLLAGLFRPAWAEGTTAPAFLCDFEDGPQLPSGWVVEGNAVIDTETASKGKQSLRLSRTAEEVDKPCTATSPAFPVKPGLWEIKGGVKSDLYSPDLSFEVVMIVEDLDAAGKVLDQKTVSNRYGKNGWDPLETTIVIPKLATSARFRFEMHKTYGQYWADTLSATYLGEAPHQAIDRLVFKTVALGNLLLPTDARTIGLHVETYDELPANEQVVTFGVRDYWGAEQMAPVKVSLKAGGQNNGKFIYDGSTDLAGVALEQGKYYEMYGEIPQPDRPFRNYSGFAIVPEAVTNNYPPQDVPFSGRNWDGRIGTGFDLSHRLGIRIMNIWSGWDAKPPYAPHAPCIELAQKYKMGVIFGCPSGSIETHNGNWQSYDDTALREGVKNLLNTYGKTVSPCYLSLGNEPPRLADRIPADVKAYQSVYEEAKIVDPNVTVIGTSVGASEDFFQAGFGKYCDVYDFHCYEDPKGIAMSVANYQQLFQKYGNPRPIWSTEIGLNSAGVARYTAAVDMVKKFATFFASGGANMSWFDLFYPDPDAKIAESNAASFNVFDCRYIQYNPKITAISDYDLINAISIKKFVAQKQYGKDVHAFLFRDKDNHALQIVWKDAGRQDAFVPLSGAQKVEVIKLDGTHRTLAAGDKGVTLSIDETPLMLLYDGAEPLADELSAPAVSLGNIPDGVTRGGAGEVSVNFTGASLDNVNLVAPPFWQVTKTAAPGGAVFTVTAPAETQARAADLTVTLADAQGGNGELYLRVPVKEQVSSRLEPVPPTDGQGPAVRLALKNNGIKKEDVTWSMSLVEENDLVNGAYDTHRPTEVHFQGQPKGTLSLNPGVTENVVLPLVGSDPLIVYRVRAIVTEGSGEPAVRERNVAGFVAVPKASGLKLDGVLDEPAWKQATVEKIDQERQYYSFDKAHVKWKGLADLSGTIRFLWDDKFLYVGVEVTDDIAGGLKEDSNLWAMDGLQFLVDPCRGQDENVGKYDYAMAVGTKGPQAWCSLTADAGAPPGVADDITVAYHRPGDGTGAITYELAIPWYRLAPFKPAAGADLGLTMILNEDDGQGRKSFMAWFGNAHSKQIDAVADLVLRP